MLLLYPGELYRLWEPLVYRPFSSVINRNRNQPFNLIQNKVGYRRCFATGVKLEQFLWKGFDGLNLIKVCATQSCISDISKSNQNHHTSHLLPCTVLTRGDVRDLHKPLYGLKRIFINTIYSRVIAFTTNLIARSKQCKLLLNFNAYIVW